MAKKTNNTNATINNSTINKEESVMMKRLEELVAQLRDNQKVQDAGYIKKDDLKDILNNEFKMGFNKKATREEMVTAVMAMYKDSIRIADEVAYGNETPASDIGDGLSLATPRMSAMIAKATGVKAVPEKVTVKPSSFDEPRGVVVLNNGLKDEKVAGVPVGDLDITHDNAPANDVAAEAPKNNQNEIIRSIIATCCNVQWNNKKQVAKNYISDFMLESCINMALHHKWSKVLMVKTDGTKDYVDSTFTESQKAATQEMKKHLLAGPYFIPHSGGKGYIISAEYMAWFYETQLHKHLIYRFTFKDTSKGHVDYKIDRANKVIINLRDNKSTPFDANTWKTVNTTLNFNKVVD
jgi:hypothetical protein